MKKSFVEWIEEKHPDFEIDENFLKMAGQAAGSVGRFASGLETRGDQMLRRAHAKFNDTGVGRAMGRVAVGAERLGRKFNKTFGKPFGVDPYERQKLNRQRNAERRDALSSFDDDWD
jgi:hypothetical protein